jgi:hypothetical protein
MDHFVPNLKDETYKEHFASTKRTSLIQGIVIYFPKMFMRLFLGGSFNCNGSKRLNSAFQKETIADTQKGPVLYASFGCNLLTYCILLCIVHTF